MFLYRIGSRGVFLYRFGSRSVNPKLKTLILCAERGLMQIHGRLMEIHGRLMEIRVKPKGAKGTTPLRLTFLLRQAAESSESFAPNGN